MSAKAERVTGIELGRIYCCFCVILIHLKFFVPAYPAVSFAWSLAKCASTPVFFLIAGFFFAEDKPFAQYMKRIMGRVMVPLVVVALIIAQLTPWLSSQGTFADCFNRLNVENLLLVGRIIITTWPYDYLPDYNPFLSLWFSFALFLCYLCVPFLKIICANNSEAKRLKGYLIGLGSVFFIFRVTILCAFPDSFTAQRLDWWIEEKPFYWLWLMLIGHELALYLKDPKFIQKWRPLLGSLSLLAYVLGGLILYIFTKLYNVDHQGLVDQRYFVREFVFYFIAQSGAFIFFCCLPTWRGFLGRLILFVADKTFYVYIIHEAVYIKLLAVTGVDLTELGPYLGYGVLTFAISLVVAVVFKKIEKTIALTFFKPKTKVKTLSVAQSFF
ncbi:MAG: acyltransferase [Deltaproteobacteria bacterium]|jgi:surface polysaccharide O-acyltransferase-like enzyme|nr:acyltransferase [Deltaproteobacteria bacterium]